MIVEKRSHPLQGQISPTAATALCAFGLFWSGQVRRTKKGEGLL